MIKNIFIYFVNKVFFVYISATVINYLLYKVAAFIRIMLSIVKPINSFKLES